MRRWLGLTLLTAAFAAWGCEQEDSSPREDDGGTVSGNFGNGNNYDNPGPGGALPGDDELDPTPAPDNVFNDFGQECSPPDGCDNTADNWPDCLNAGCRTGDCTYPGLAGDYGYCTRGCTRDEECENAMEGPYGADFVCMTDGVSGTCVPGSGERCDRLRNGQCTDPDEVCKWGVIYAADQTYGGTCQPPTEGGRDVGQGCNEEQGIYCANDLCLFDTCTTLCDPHADPARSPCPNGWTCFDEFDIGVTLDVCLPAYCETSSDCADGFTCVLTFEFNSETVLRGICLATDEGQAQPGENCSDERPCQGATCFDNDEGGFCAGMCDTDADCGPGAYCDIVTFGIQAEPGSAPAQICTPGERTGSGRACEVDADCAADEDNPQEACDYYVAGDLEGGRYVSPPRLAGRCAAIPANAVGFGEVCSDLQPCNTEGLCLRGGGGAFCSAACRDSRDCDGAVCFAIDFGGQNGGVCIPADVFGLEGASLAACGNDDDCLEDGETCKLNLVEASQNPVAELLCQPGGGRRGAGEACANADQCASLDCQPRSNDPDDPGYCRAPCRVDADCGAGFSCERVRPLAGGNPLNMCRPIAACQPCAFDGSAPCGGDYACGLVTYGNDDSGGACLATCDGPGDFSCADGFSCEPVIGGDGRVQPGNFACTPLLPDETCTDARPL